VRNIQTYNQYIKDLNNKIEKIKKEAFKYVEEEIIPKIEEIVDSYIDQYSELSVSIYDDEFNEKGYRWSSFEEEDIYECLIGIYFLSESNQKAREINKEIYTRVLSELGDDVYLDKIDYHKDYNNLACEGIIIFRVKSD
jgi:hypothetical protein